MKSTHLAALVASATLALTIASAPAAMAQTSSQQAQQQQQNAPEPDITTHQQDGREVQEYRVNGKLYAIKIKPPHGPAYYLVDTDGDGNFQRQDDTSRVVVPRWTIASW